MQSLRSFASRIWPVAAAAVISFAGFWGIVVFGQRLAVWLLSLAPLFHGRHFPFPVLVVFFAAFFPTMMAVGQRKKKNLGRGKSLRRGL